MCSTSLSKDSDLTLLDDCNALGEARFRFCIAEASGDQVRMQAAQQEINAAEKLARAHRAICEARENNLHIEHLCPRFEEMK
jgi:hypothetical protein